MCYLNAVQEMKSKPLEYTSVRPRRLARWWVLAGVVVAVLVTTQFINEVLVRSEFGWIDSVSGSRKSQTITRWGSVLPPVIAVSPLARKFSNLGLVWQPDWRNVRSSAIPLIGRSYSLGHGSAPTIYDLSFHNEVQQYFIDHSSDEEIRAFFSVMITGTDLQQKVAIEAMFNKYFDAAK